VNIIAGLVNNKPITPMVFNGSYNTLLFETWVEKLLIKELQPGQVVIMDRAKDEGINLICKMQYNLSSPLFS
jgi:hypothetical protein